MSPRRRAAKLPGSSDFTPLQLRTLCVLVAALTAGAETSQSNSWQSCPTEARR